MLMALHLAVETRLPLGHGSRLEGKRQNTHIYPSNLSSSPQVTSSAQLIRLFTVLHLDQSSRPFQSATMSSLPKIPSILSPTELHTHLQNTTPGAPRTIVLDVSIALPPHSEYKQYLDARLPNARFFNLKRWGGQPYKAGNGKFPSITPRGLWIVTWVLLLYMD